METRQSSKAARNAVYSKVRRVSDKYYIYTDRGKGKEFVEVEGISIPNEFDMDIFLHKDICNNRQIVSEGITGLRLYAIKIDIVKDYTVGNIEEAVAKIALNNIEIYSGIEYSINNRIISPRYGLIKVNKRTRVRKSKKEKAEHKL